MGHPDQMDESDWQGIDKTTDDPEEARVMFCALDSFLSVSSSMFSDNFLRYWPSSFRLLSLFFVFPALGLVHLQQCLLHAS